MNNVKLCLYNLYCVTMPDIKQLPLKIHKERCLNTARVDNNMTVHAYDCCTGQRLLRPSSALHLKPAGRRQSWTRFPPARPLAHGIYSLSSLNEGTDLVDGVQSLNPSHVLSSPILPARYTTGT